MRVKICGLKTEADIDAVNSALPDYIGFVFAPGSKRYIDFGTAEALRERLRPEIQAAGVFVNAGPQVIREAAERKLIDIIQLHGTESPADILQAKANTGLPVIKAVRVRTEADILRAERSAADYLLLDTYSTRAYGGTGRRFDWSLIPNLEKPFFLAGGLREENLAEALKQRAFCLDVSSGAETDGRKDPMKIRRIVERIRKEGE